MRRVLLAVLVTAATTMMMAGPAHAGGPTSVLLTSPGYGPGRGALLHRSPVRRARGVAARPGGRTERDDDRLPGYSRGHRAQHHLAGPRRERLADRPAGPRRSRRTLGGDVDDAGRRQPGARRADLAGPEQRGPDQERSSPRSACSAGPGATTREPLNRHGRGLAATHRRRRRCRGRRPRRHRAGGATRGDPLVHPDRLEVGRTWSASRYLRRVGCAPERSCRLRTAPGVHRCRARAGYCAWLTLDMLKSGTRRAGVAVRLNSSPHSRLKLGEVAEACENRSSRSTGLSLNRKLFTAPVISPFSTR